MPIICADAARDADTADLGVFGVNQVRLVGWVDVHAPEGATEGDLLARAQPLASEDEELILVERIHHRAASPFIERARKIEPDKLGPNRTGKPGERERWWTGHQEGVTVGTRGSAEGPVTPDPALGEFASTLPTPGRLDAFLELFNTHLQRIRELARHLADLFLLFRRQLELNRALGVWYLVGELREQGRSDDGKAPPSRPV